MPRWALAASLTLAAALAGVVAALVMTGAAAPRDLGDPGPAVRWGLPLARSIYDVASAAAIGGLLFASCIVRPDSPVQRAATGLAGAAALVWTAMAAAVGILTYADASGLPLSGDAAYTQALGEFFTQFDLGRAWLAAFLVACVVTTLTFAVRSLTALGLTLILAVLGIVPMALTGHSASGDDHMAAVNSMGLHLLGASLWVGGVLVLAVVGVRALARKDIVAEDLAVAAARFSPVAAVSLVLVVASGVVNALVRITEPAQLLTPWGTIILLKTVLALAAGYLGWLHRSVTIPRLPEAPRLFGRLILVEALVLGLVSGLAAGLGRTSPPRPEELPPAATPARILTGYDLPPELTAERFVDVWRPDWLWIAVAVALLVAYARGVVRLHRRGDSWPIARFAAFVVGLAALTYFTSGAPAVYGQVLFSQHMLEHMALTMFVPMFLVMGAPVTLALRALAPRQDGTRGPREWILILVHSWWSRLVTHPLVAAANFVGSIILFYYTDLFGLTMTYHVGHELMVLHFTLTGYIFVLTMIGQDPLPKRYPYPLRLVLLFATMAFHAFFGVTLMGSDVLLQPFWFGNMGRPWGLDAIGDQQLGGGITWGVGELPTLVVALGVMLQWSRADTRESARKDRAADRDDDAELRAYNEMLAQRARMGGPRP
ncbi:cytochrome c oxidase assembly protein [Falsarthrobacter nasiphocae]|uniref:Copper resistance protein D n=1 Tax=Falsarthrobacter nasiphocae TaxID=189863 RepID=A0AAE3YE85_9MICC|nr:cytochrome c oxidase assembly protein [Falsarthrobacter nasiphocae]MDR6892263.1 putative copper resistance protein D [Falsarthrobacter nasiphocae]